MATIPGGIFDTGAVSDPVGSSLLDSIKNLFGTTPVETILSGSSGSQVGQSAIITPVSTGNGTASVAGGAGFDVVMIDSASGNNKITFDSKVNSLIVQGGNSVNLTLAPTTTVVLDQSTPVTIVSGGGADIIDVRGTGNYTIAAGAGNDSVIGGSGQQSIFGGDGDDVISGGVGNDIVFGVIVKEEGADPSWFDGAFYLAQNPDVAQAISAGIIATPYDHFIAYGQYEGREPNAQFDSAYYLDLNPDVAAAVAAGTFSSAFEHYLAYGQYEGRLFSAEAARSGLSWFDSAYYLTMNPDVAAALDAGIFSNALEHYVKYGQAEGRNANRYFDADYYLAQNPDVAAAVANGIFPSALDHFLRAGGAEGRAPGANIDIETYTAANPDIVGSGMSAYVHAVRYGAGEGRSINANSTLDGGEGNDTITVAIGNNSLVGGSGNDTITGGAGNDTMTGGSGNDTFVMKGNIGADVITDFTKGNDKIQLVGQSLTINQIVAGVTEDGNGNAILDLGNNNKITLIGVSAAQVTADMFQVG